MPTVKLPITTIPYKNIDSISNERLGVDMLDGLIDDSETLIRRPGLTLELDLGTGRPVDGIYWWDKKKFLIAVSNGQLFKITNDVTTVTNLTSDTLNIGTQVIFADNGDDLFATNGAQIVSTDGVSNTAYLSDPDAPTDASHLAYIDTYILANKLNSNGIAFSNAGDPFTWNALDVFVSESLPDNVNAIFTNYREIGVFGRQSFDVFQNDGQTPFSRLDGTFIEKGALAPYSIQEVDNTYFWIDDKKRVIRTNNLGRGAQSVSTPFDKVIQQFDTVEDARGMFMTPEGWKLYVLQFPTQGRTLVYDIAHNYWGEWTEYKTGTNSREPWLGNCYAFEREANKHIVGSRVDGKLYSIDFDNSSDNTEIISTVKLTGHIDHGTSDRKLSKSLSLKLKRGEGASGTSPEVMLRWKDDGDIGFSTEVKVPLLDVNRENFFYRLQPMGTYKSRQYKFKITDNVPGTLAYVEEDFEVLANG